MEYSYETLTNLTSKCLNDNSKQNKLTLNQYLSYHNCFEACIEIINDSNSQNKDNLLEIVELKQQLYEKDQNLLQMNQKLQEITESYDINKIATDNRVSSQGLNLYINLLKFSTDGIINLQVVYDFLNQLENYGLPEKKKR